MKNYENLHLFYKSEDENGSFWMGRSKKGPDPVYIYWLRKIDSGFCFQNQENRTWNKIFFLNMKKGKKKEPTSSRIEHRTYGLPGIHLYQSHHWDFVRGKQLLNTNITDSTISKFSADVKLLIDQWGQYGGIIVFQLLRTKKL